MIAKSKITGPCLQGVKILEEEVLYQLLRGYQITSVSDSSSHNRTRSETGEVVFLIIHSFDKQLRLLFVYFSLFLRKKHRETLWSFLCYSLVSTDKKKSTTSHVPKSQSTIVKKHNYCIWKVQSSIFPPQTVNKSSLRNKMDIANRYYILRNKIQICSCNY